MLSGSPQDFQRLDASGASDSTTLIASIAGLDNVPDLSTSIHDAPGGGAHLPAGTTRRTPRVGGCHVREITETHVPTDGFEHSQTSDSHHQSRSPSPWRRAILVFSRTKKHEASRGPRAWPCAHGPPSKISSGTLSPHNLTRRPVRRLCPPRGLPASPRARSSPRGGARNATLVIPPLEFARVRRDAHSLISTRGEEHVHPARGLYCEKPVR